MFFFRWIAAVILRKLLRQWWGWLVLALPFVLIGGGLAATAHVAHPVQMNGTITSFKEFQKSDGAYDHNELLLAGDTHTYEINKFDFNPKLPDSVYKDGNVSIWTDGTDSTSVIAMTLYDENNENPTQYTTDSYTHPEHALSNQRTAGFVIGGIGLALIVVGLLWLKFGWGKKKVTSAQPATVAAAAPVGYANSGQFPPADPHQQSVDWGRPPQH